MRLAYWGWGLDSLSDRLPAHTGSRSRVPDPESRVPQVPLRSTETSRRSCSRIARRAIARLKTVRATTGGDVLCVAGAPFSLLDYESARARAREIAEATLTLAMPPGFPKQDTANSSTRVVSAINR